MKHPIMHNLYYFICAAGRVSEYTSCIKRAALLSTSRSSDVMGSGSKCITSLRTNRTSSSILVRATRSTERFSFCHIFRMPEETDVFPHRKIGNVLQSPSRSGLLNKQREIICRNLVFDDLPHVKFYLAEQKKWLRQISELLAQIARSHHTANPTIMLSH
jgi:hypothetical protein